MLKVLFALSALICTFIPDAWYQANCCWYNICASAACIESSRTDWRFVSLVVILYRQTPQDALCGIKDQDQEKQISLIIFPIFAAHCYSRSRLDLFTFSWLYGCICVVLKFTLLRLEMLEVD